MPVRLIVPVAAVCAALSLLASWAFDIPLERIAFLAPVVVVAAGGVAFLVVLWTKVIVETVRRRPRGE